MYQMIDWFIDWLIYFSQEHTGGGGSDNFPLRFCVQSVWEDFLIK